MARQRKRSDDIYNARRRYRRQAERYEKKATNATGIEKSRYQQLARTSLEKAYALYDDPTTAKGTRKMQEMSARLKPRRAVKKLSDKQRKSIIRQSQTATKSEYDDEEIREIEAMEILNSSVGSRVYGALTDVWKDAEDINAAIMDYFGVDSMADVLDAIEQAGIDIYADPESTEKYDEVRTALENAFRK